MEILVRGQKFSHFWPTSFLPIRYFHARSPISAGPLPVSQRNLRNRVQRSGSWSSTNLKGSVNTGLYYHKSRCGDCPSLVTSTQIERARKIDAAQPGNISRSTRLVPLCRGRVENNQPLLCHRAKPSTYMAFTECVQEACSLSMQLTELKTKEPFSLVNNPIVSNRYKHTDIKHHFSERKIYTPLTSCPSSPRCCYFLTLLHLLLFTLNFFIRNSL